MKKMILVSLIALSLPAFARPDFETRPSAPSVTLKEKMLTEFQNQFDRPLSLQERDAVVGFAAQAELLGDRLNSQVASVANEPADVTTVLFCLGAKGALMSKVGALICMDTSINAYIIRQIGIGVSVGVAGQGLILIHKGSVGSIKGEYNGLAAGTVPLLLAQGFSAMLRVAGGEIAYFANTANGSKIIGGGFNIGPMIIDFSGTRLTVD